MKTTLQEFDPLWLLAACLSFFNLEAVRGAATFSDANWASIGGGVNNTVAAAVVDESGNLYIGGSFMGSLLGDVASRIAKWDGNSWSALDSGMEGVEPTLVGYPAVYAIAVLGNDVYAGGGFTTAGGVPATNIAKWNGSNWSSLGSGMGGSGFPFVRALAVSGTDLYAGGSFATAGGVTVNYIAKWDGTNWSALDSGMNHSVRALAVSGSTLYAGGDFTTAGGVAVNHIAKWDGTNWSALGSGMGGDDPEVNALAVSGTDLYAGGYFTTAGGIAATNVAKWNGSNWLALGSGTDPDSDVFALTVFENNLFVGGVFRTAGGTEARHIAKWNGSSWSALGSGTDGGVRTLTISRADLIAGGYFFGAGNKGVGCVARARISSIAMALMATNSFASVRFSGVTGYEYDVQRTTSLNPPITWTNLTISPLSPVPDGLFTFTDTNAPPGEAYYRAVER